jgi:hypothetical protein
MTEEAKTGLELAIADAEIALAKENDTAPASVADTIEGAGTDTVAGADTIPGSDTIAAPAGEDTLTPVEPKAKKKPWFMDEISGLRDRARRAEEERNAALELLKKQPQTPEQMAEAEIERRAAAKAEQMTQARMFGTKIQGLGDKGREKYEDFNDAANALHAIGLTSDQFLDIAADLPNGADILYHLGTNPEEALALTKLSPVKQALELTKLETKLAKPAVTIVKEPISKAVAPIKSIAGNSGAEYTGNDPEKLLSSSEDGVTKFWRDYYNKRR